MLESELNLIVEHSVGVWKIIELVGGDRKYHIPCKERERKRKVNSKQDYSRISAVLFSSLYGGAKFYVFLKLLIDEKRR